MSGLRVSLRIIRTVVLSVKLWPGEGDQGDITKWVRMMEDMARG